MIPFLELADQLHIVVPGYMLVFTRLSAMLITLPIFSYPMISGRIRIMFGFVLTLIIGSIVNTEAIPPITNLWVLTGLMVKEMIIGMIIGFVREKLNNNDLKEKIKGLKSIIIINIKELFLIN